MGTNRRFTRLAAVGCVIGAGGLSTLCSAPPAGAATVVSGVRLPMPLAQKTDEAVQISDNGQSIGSEASALSVLGVAIHTLRWNSAGTTVTDLFPFLAHFAYPVGIDAQGNVAENVISDVFGQQPTLYKSNGTVVTLPGTKGEITAISPSGAILEDYYVNGVQAVGIYANGALKQIALGNGDYGTSINDNGQAVIVNETVTGAAQEWTGTSLIALGVPAGDSNPYPSEINDSGEVVGTLGGPTGGLVTWQSGVLSVVSTTASDYGLAHPLNNSGAIIGYIMVPVGNTLVNDYYLWQGGTTTELGTTHKANDINDNGQVVGGDTATNDAFVYSHGSYLEFGLSGAVSATGVWINNHDQVLGDTNNSTGGDVATLWTISGS